MSARPVSQSSLGKISVAIVLILLMAIPGLIWFHAGGGIAGYLEGDELPGQWAYMLTKLSGLYACLAASLQSIYGIVGRRFLAQSGWWQVTLHRVFGLITFTLAAAHLVLFMIAVTFRTGQVPYHLLLPEFASGFYRSALSLGWLALAILAGVLTAALTRHLWPGRWIWLHRLAPLVVLLGVSHGLLVGSEAKTPVLTVFYVCNGLAVVGTIFWSVRKQRLRFPASVPGKTPAE